MFVRTLSVYISTDALRLCNVRKQETVTESDALTTKSNGNDCLLVFKLPV